jgi:hypothetical protein
MITSFICIRFFFLTRSLLCARGFYLKFYCNLHLINIILYYIILYYTILYLYYLNYLILCHFSFDSTLSLCIYHFIDTLKFIKVSIKI